MITSEKLRVLLEVAQRAPASLAEQIICQEVADELIAIYAPAPEPPQVAPASLGAPLVPDRSPLPVSPALYHPRDVPPSRQNGLETPPPAE